MTTQNDFEPIIVGFFCNWCSYTAADLAGTARMKYPGNLRIIRVMCSGRVDPAFVLRAFASGADGVLVAGCHPGDCHYLSGNYQAYKRQHLLESLLDQFGIERERCRLEFIAGSEGDRVAEVAHELTNEVRRLGPLVLSSGLLRQLDGLDTEPALSGGGVE